MFRPTSPRTLNKLSGEIEHGPLIRSVSFDPGLLHVPSGSEVPILQNFRKASSVEVDLMELHPTVVARSLHHLTMRKRGIRVTCPHIYRELTLKEFSIFKRISPREFLNQAWQKPGKEYLAPNITKLINRFNEVRTAIFPMQWLLLF